MTFVKKQDYKYNRGLELSQVDNVNRSGYIPLDVQVERMKLAGIRLDNINNHQYNYELQHFLDSGMRISDYTTEQSLKTRFNDKVELDMLYKAKLDKLSTHNNNVSKVKALHSEYVKEMHEKRIADEAIINYKRSLENK